MRTLSSQPKIARQVRLTAVAVFIALVALTLAWAATVAGRPAVSAARLSRATVGNWQVAPLITSHDLRDVDMVSPDDGWAVGEQGTVLRHDTSGWQSTWFSSTDLLVDVFMLSPTNGYILGWGEYGGDVFHWNGTSWALEYTAPSTLNRIAASGPSDVWAVGLNITVHWDGIQWSVVPPPVNRQLFAVQVPSATEAWAVGQYEPISMRGLILHNTGSGWVQVSSPAPQTIFDTFFRAPDDGWAAGYEGYNSYVLHYDGAAWSRLFTNTLQLDRLDMLTSSDGWAISSISNSIARYDGTDFYTVTNPSPVGKYIGSISMASSQDGWIVGTFGLMLHYSDSATPTVTPTRTATVTPTATPCAMNFSDVSPSDYFYASVRYLFCMGAISGYADGTFRPYNNTTRGQLSKIVVLAERWSINTTGGPHFSDVNPGSTFYDYIETAYNRGVISGYADGTFRPGNNVTRGQLCKIIVSAEGWPINTTGGPHFTDVAPGSTFYDFIETAFNRSVISGYADGTFRPGASATRGQISKMVYSAVTGPARAALSR